MLDIAWSLSQTVILVTHLFCSSLHKYTHHLLKGMPASLTRSLHQPEVHSLHVFCVRHSKVLIWLKRHVILTRPTFKTRCTVGEQGQNIRYGKGGSVSPTQSLVYSILKSSRSGSARSPCPGSEGMALNGCCLCPGGSSCSLFPLATSRVSVEGRILLGPV